MVVLVIIIRAAKSHGLPVSLQVSRWVLKISRDPLKWSFMHGFCIYALKKHTICENIVCSFEINPYVFVK